ncbi:28102_t:CDS:2 [Racocetra persica]|uniref:28102_t:CDS:1 n=1 Tax=Racocetra persica TaxID=160502 RepID=A0ACA9QV13_9GLOM|nr:28102_t:CDS:2 [Racocetra persica]
MGFIMRLTSSNGIRHGWGLETCLIIKDYYDYFRDEDLEESFSTNQDKPLFIHDHLAAIKARCWLEEQVLLEIQDKDDNDDHDNLLSEDEHMNRKFLDVEKDK